MISATMIGRVGRDAELKKAGQSDVLKFNLASSEKTKDGETTTWVSCELFGARASKLAQYVTKGKLVGVRGSLKQREYVGKDGTKKQSLELRADDIELLGGKDQSATTNGTRPTASQTEQFGDYDGEETPF